MKPSPLFVIVYHWSQQNKDEIYEEFDKEGVLKGKKFVEAIPREVLETHYKTHKGKKHYPYMISDLEGTQATVAVYMGNYNSFLQTKRKLRDKFNSTIPDRKTKGHKRRVVHTTENEEDFWNYEWPAWGRFFKKTLFCEK